jgi:tetratricopeptide (TPR) repeat protein
MTGDLRTLVVTAAASGLLAAGSPVAAADRTWTEAKSTHFVVVSDAGEKAARNTLWQFEQFRIAVKSAWPWASVDLDRPILVLLARDEATMRSLTPQFWEQKNSVRPGAVFETGVDRYYVALRADEQVNDRQGQVNPYFTAYWSYVTAVLRTGRSSDLPLWLAMGIAEMMSNTIVRDTHVEIGRVPPWYVERLRTGSKVAWEDVLAVTDESPLYRDARRRPALDAQAWVVVHYFLFADKGAHQDRLNRFIELVLQGRPPAAAFELTLGPVQTIARNVAVYAAGQLFNYTRVKIDTKVRQDEFSARTLTPVQAAAARAGLHAAMRRPAEARAELTAVRGAEPDPALFEVEGVLSDIEQKPDDARAAYAKAVELGSTNFLAFYRAATLMIGANADADAFAAADRLLKRAVALNDRFAASYAALGETAMRLGRGADAVAVAKHAVALDPGSVSNRLSLARVFWGLSQKDDALRQAREALAIARTEDEKHAAQQLIDFMARPVSLQLPAWPIAASSRRGSRRKPPRRSSTIR